jgi:hydroxylamine reductase (hybrid-cluster protein)
LELLSGEKTLKQLELLSGEKKNADYNSVITFIANGVKVNAFMNGREIRKREVDNPNNYVGAFGEEGHYNKIMVENASFVRVSDVNCILTAKFRLRRMKDYKFAKDLASTILNIGF